MPVKVTAQKGLRQPTCMDYVCCSHKLKASIVMEKPSHTSSPRNTPLSFNWWGVLVAAASFALCDVEGECPPHRQTLHSPGLTQQTRWWHRKQCYTYS